MAEKLLRGIGNKDFLLRIIFMGIVIILVSVFVRMVVIAIKQNRHIDIKKVSLQDKWVYGIIEDYAYDVVEERYKQLGKSITTQKDELRVNYVNDTKKQLALIIKSVVRTKNLTNHFVILSMKNIRK